MIVFAGFDFGFVDRADSTNVVPRTRGLFILQIAIFVVLCNEIVFFCNRQFNTYIPIVLVFIFMFFYFG